MTEEQTKQKITAMTEGGAKLGLVLDELLQRALPGTTLLSLEEHALKRIYELGGTPSFQTVKGYRWATCLCVNDVVVHGIPTAYKLRHGDLLTIDVGLLYKGFHTDTAWSILIHDPHATEKVLDLEEKKKMLTVGEQALWEAISVARAGSRVGHISEVIQRNMDSAGLRAIKSLVGHGVGRTLHEEPQIPGFLRGPIERTPELRVGMTIAVELIFSAGSSEAVYVNDDGWTLGTKDGSNSCVFEHTIAITEGEPKLITGGSLTGAR